jgi:hypothetical protein
VLEFLSSRKALPPDLARWWAVEVSPAREAAWRAAFEALARDADAPLPT